MFLSDKEITENQGTKRPVRIPSRQLPDGLPIRAFGTFSLQVNDASQFRGNKRGAAVGQDFEMRKIGATVTALNVASFSYHNENSGKNQQAGRTLI